MVSRARQNSQLSHNPDEPLEFAIVKLLVDHGFHHKRIAALFDCNQGRIAEIARGHRGASTSYSFKVK